MRRSAVTLILSLTGGAFGLFFLFQLYIRLVFALAGAGRTDPAAVAELPFPERHPTQPGALHEVAEWPSSAPRAFSQSPELANRGLPSVEERVPEDPMVIIPPHQEGPYGGTWTRFGTGPQDIRTMSDRIAYEGLVRWGPMGRRILPNLATDWEVADGGRTYTFHLRRGVRWSDGNPFTAADIMFWYEHVLKNPDLTPVVTPELRYEGRLVELEAPDDTTIRFRFAAPYGLFLKVLASNFAYVVEYPAHVLRNYHPAFTPLAELNRMARSEGFSFWYQLFLDRASWQNPESPRLWAWILEHPPPARPVVFVRNPYYWKVDPSGRQLPYIDRITFENHDLETINLKAINGEVGMQGRHISFQNYPLFMTNRKRSGYRVLHWIDGKAGSSAIALNLSHKDPVLKAIFHDRRFRFALSQALDRNAINEVCYMGVGRPRQMAPPPGSAFYDADYERAYIDYDPEESRRLLDAMGLSRFDDRGRRLRSDGKPLTLRIEGTASWGGSSRLLEMIAASWTAVGVETKVKIMARELYMNRIFALLFDVTAWTGTGEMNPVIDPRWFLPYNGGSFYGLEYVPWFRTQGAEGEEPPPAMVECMDIFRQVQRTMDEAEQIRLFRRIIDLNRENLWVIGTVGQIPPIFIVHESFRNVPEVAVACWPLRTPGSTAPECYAIDLTASDES